MKKKSIACKSPFNQLGVSQSSLLIPSLLRQQFFTESADYTKGRSSAVMNTKMERHGDMRVALQTHRVSMSGVSTGRIIPLNTTEYSGLQLNVTQILLKGMMPKPLPVVYTTENRNKY
ncbi:MAG: hypothetical protein ICV63_15930 [Coleofasciculus sp. Co-bin14]|nr:hypothetical protein [Coleofasciculus sp. Co-bin14]